ncbi:MAG TPA: alpha-amylase family glycosyl hydrolase, partial [Puia sp.]
QTQTSKRNKMKQPNYPSLFQVNTRVWITEISEGIGRRATLDDIPDEDLDRLADFGFDWIWFLSIWTTGKAAQTISRGHSQWRHEFQETLPDLQEEDIAGSGFAIKSYTVHPDLGGDMALSKLRSRLKKRGLRLMLDFVPNHMAPDHPWVEEHPEFFVAGTENDLQNSPQNYTLVKRKNGNLILAYGRDPYFAGWPDTLQLDYSNPATQEALIRELLRISGQCDGLRCDMAMLVLPEVFERTWGRKAQPFWPKAIARVRETVPGFTFMAEVYWDLEWTMMQQGFDYAYDKHLYDRLREGQTGELRGHLNAAPDYQKKLARFLENHDEPRAAATFDSKKHKAAAVITFLSQGLRFFHQGQFTGRKKRISPHLVRAPQESIDHELQRFYSELLNALKNSVFRNGQWRQLDPLPAWDGNNSCESFLAFLWEDEFDNLAMVVVNYAPHQGQCYIKLPIQSLADQSLRFRDMMSSALYDREGNKILSEGIYLDMPAWGYHIFEVTSPANSFLKDPVIRIAAVPDLP